MSRNDVNSVAGSEAGVTSRKGRVSRNISKRSMAKTNMVTSRKGRVSRNVSSGDWHIRRSGHVPQGTCE